MNLNKLKIAGIPAMKTPRQQNLSISYETTEIAVKIATVLLILSSALMSNLCFSMPDDHKKMAQLAANSADLNQQTHHGEYRGDVQFDQGTAHLRAAQATTESNEQNKLVFAVANGSKNEQAHFWIQTALDKPLLHAYADSIRYYPERHLIELIGNARIVQGNDSFTASKISYDTFYQHIISQGDNKKRSVITIHSDALLIPTPEKH